MGKGENAVTDMESVSLLVTYKTTVTKYSSGLQVPVKQKKKIHYLFIER